MPAIAYYLLQKAILRKQGPESLLANALGTDVKGKISPVLYAAAILLAFVSSWISIAIYVMVAVMWLVPDRRIISFDARTLCFWTAVAPVLGRNVNFLPLGPMIGVYGAN